MATRAATRKTPKKTGPGTTPRTSANTVYVHSTAQVLRELDFLKQIGLFGNSRGEIAEELMRAQLRQLHREGWFRPPLAPLLDVTPAASGGSDDEQSSRGSSASSGSEPGATRSGD